MQAPNGASLPQQLHSAAQIFRVSVPSHLLPTSHRCPVETMMKKLFMVFWNRWQGSQGNTCSGTTQTSSSLTKPRQRHRLSSLITSPKDGATLLRAMLACASWMLLDSSVDGYVK